MWPNGLQPFLVKLTLRNCSNFVPDESRRFMNEVTLLGRVARDPSSVGPDIERMLTFVELATNRYFEGEDGKLKKDTQFHTCVITNQIRNTREAVVKNVRKGQRLYIEGALHYRNEERDGFTDKKPQILVKQVVFLQN